MTPETRDFFHWLSALIALPAAAYAGQPFFRERLACAARARAQHGRADLARRDPRARHVAWSKRPITPQHAYFDSAIMLLFFLLCGRALDHAMRRKTRAVAGNLAALEGRGRRTASKDGEIVQRARRPRCKPGDRLLVRPGERMPADGVVVSGISEIDESLVTGETARRAVAAGATVYAGSVNFSGALTIRVTAAAAARCIDEVERLLEKAVERQVALRAAGRPRGAHLCAGRACDRGADRARLAARRRVGCTTRS